MQDEGVHPQRVAQNPPGPEILRITERWTDRHSGLLTAIDDSDYLQLPLVRANICTPLASTSHYTLPVVEAAGLDYAEVRWLAIRESMARYLESLALEESAVYEDEQHHAVGGELVPPEHIFGWLHTPQTFRAQAPFPWLKAMEMERPGTFFLVPGAAIARWSQWNQAGTTHHFAQTTSGTGLGTSWSEALAQGLLSLCCALTQHALPHPLETATLRPVAREAYSTDSQCAAYLSMLDILHIHATVLDVTDRNNANALPAYTVLVEHDQQTPATPHAEVCSLVFTHWHPLAAIRAALQAVVLRWQIARDPRVSTQEFPAWCPVYPSYDTQSVVTALPTPRCAEQAYAAGNSALQQYVHSLGWRIAVAPLPQDMTVKELLPCAIRVLAIR